MVRANKELFAGSGFWLPHRTWTCLRLFKIVIAKIKKKKETKLLIRLADLILNVPALSPIRRLLTVTVFRGAPQSLHTTIGAWPWSSNGQPLHLKQHRKIICHYVRLWQRCYFGFKSSGMWYCVVVRKVSGVSKDRDAIIFMFEQSKKLLLDYLILEDEGTATLRNIWSHLP